MWFPDSVIIYVFGCRAWLKGLLFAIGWFPVTENNINTLAYRDITQFVSIVSLDLHEYNFRKGILVFCDEPAATLNEFCIGKRHTNFNYCDF
jgi:hypothetical protein